MSHAPVSPHVSEPLDNEFGQFQVPLSVQVKSRRYYFYDLPRRDWIARFPKRGHDLARELRKNCRLGLVTTLEDGRLHIPEQQNSIYGSDTGAAVVRSSLGMGEFGDKLSTFLC
jgi:hypothetical protein